MKVAIFENEYEQVENSFQYVNKIYYKDQLEYSIFTKSQDFSRINDILNYSIIFVDLDLSVKSEMDGYSLITDFLKLKRTLPLIILTGASNVEETLKKKGLPQFEILTKPVNYKKLLKIFERYLKQINK